MAIEYRILGYATMSHMSEKLIVKGLDGKKTLAGEIKINGAKNAVLKAIAAALLFDGPVTLENVPDTEDVSKMSDLLIALGVSVTMDIAGKKITIDATGLLSTDLDHTISQSMRSSVVTTGPLLGRYGHVSFPAPGGCVIGTRPIDLFIEGYKKMGATVTEVTDVNDNSRYNVTAPTGGLTGAEIIFPIQTVGGTETLMMAALLAHGTTILKNCAMEPEIVDLAHYLISCGAHIEGVGSPTIVITGRGHTPERVADNINAKNLLSTKGKSYRTVPDRIEAGSFLLLGALCAKDLKITHCEPAHLDVVIAMLRDSGVALEVGKDFIHIKGTSAQNLKPFNIRTHEYPGFPTDLQAPAVVYLTQAAGESIIFETIFEGRFKYADDLKKMGASVTIMNPREILVKGPAALKALDGVDGDQREELQAYDIRAGFAVIMAALLARGTSVIKNIYFIDRGYENIEGRLRAIGADIQRTSVEE